MNAGNKYINPIKPNNWYVITGGPGLDKKVNRDRIAG